MWWDTFQVYYELYILLSLKHNISVIGTVINCIIITVDKVSPGSGILEYVEQHTTHIMVSIELKFWQAVCECWWLKLKFFFMWSCIVDHVHQPPLIVFPIYTTPGIRGLMKDVWLEHNEAIAYFGFSVHDILNKHSLSSWTCHCCSSTHHMPLL